MNHCSVRRRIGRQRAAELATVTAAALVLATHVSAHDPNATITWNRDISRLVYERCASCHRPRGTAFSLMTYQDAQPRAASIKESVLSRRMPPWGAVKGFGAFRNDVGLTQEQISLITDWVETGALRGNNPNALPPVPKFEPPPPFDVPNDAVSVSGDVTLKEPLVLDGLLPERVAAHASLQIIAARPDGAIEPLLWLYEYRDAYRHPFLLRRPLPLPAGTVIHGVPTGAKILLLPAERAHS